MSEHEKFAWASLVASAAVWAFFGMRLTDGGQIVEVAFDEAVKVAYEFQKNNIDTLLIITGDHETGGLATLSYSATSLKSGRNGVVANVSELQQTSRWATMSHTATHLFVWGIGPGSEEIKGWKHNSELFGIMLNAYGF